MFNFNIFDIGNTIKEAIIGFFLAIDSLIYGFIGYVYQIFLYLAQAKIFEETFFQEFSQRIYILIGIVMLFVITYTLLKAIVNPDELMKGENSASKLASNILISLIMIVLVPTIFQYIYKVQNVILQEGVIGKIVLGFNDTVTVPSTTVTAGEGVPSYTYGGATISQSKSALALGGNTLAVQAFQAFFYPTSGDGTKVSVKNPLFKSGFWGYAIATLSCVGGIVLATGGTAATLGIAAPSYGAAALNCGAAYGVVITTDVIGSAMGKDITLAEAYAYAQATGDFSMFAPFAIKVGQGEEGVTYNFILSTVAGAFILYMMISFCFDLGIRAVKLGFYQLIAPIPILSRILPGQKKIFDNWVKAVSTTFLEVFIRVIIIYFGILLISQLPDVLDTILWTQISGHEHIGIGVSFLVRLFLIMGVIAFMKQAPKLIGDLFGIDSGNIKLGIGEKLGAGGALMAGGIIGGGITSGVRNAFQADKGNRFKSFMGGLGSGAVRGGKANVGSKSVADMKKNTSQAIKDTTDKRAARAAYKASHGGTTGGALRGHLVDSLRTAAGISTGDKQYYVDNPLSEVDFHNDVIQTHTDLRTAWGSEFDDKVDEAKKQAQLLGDFNTGRATDPNQQTAMDYWMGQHKKATDQRDLHRQQNLQATAYRFDEHLAQLMASEKLTTEAKYDVAEIKRMQSLLSRDSENNILYRGHMITQSEMDSLMNQRIGSVDRWDDTAGAIITQDAKFGSSSGSQLSKEKKSEVENSANYQELAKQRERQQSGKSGNEESKK